MCGYNISNFILVILTAGAIIGVIAFGLAQLIVNKLMPK